MAKDTVRIRHVIEYLLLQGFIFAIKVSPFFFINFYQHVTRLVLKKMLRGHGRLITRNLRTAFPRMSSGHTARLKENIYRHFAMVFVHILFFYIKQKPNSMVSNMEVCNLHRIRNALAKNRGVILFSAHFGNWELVPYILSRQLDTRIYSIARKMDNPLVERVVKRFREFMGSRIIYKKGSIRKTFNLLERNKIFFFLIDQNTVPREAVFVDFFGQKTSAINSVARLSLKKNTPVLPVFLHYEKHRVYLNVCPELSPEKSGNMDEDIIALTQAYTTIIEHKIRQHPAQWFWFHNRWKTKPTGG